MKKMIKLLFFSLFIADMALFAQENQSSMEETKRATPEKVPAQQPVTGWRAPAMGYPAGLPPQTTPTETMGQPIMPPEKTMMAGEPVIGYPTGYSRQKNSNSNQQLEDELRTQQYNRQIASPVEAQAGRP